MPPGSELLGDAAWGQLLSWHDQALRSLFAEHGGEEVKQIGDGFFVAFERPAPAFDCAVAIQRTLAKHRQEHGFAPQVRIGIHEAEATRTGADYEGRGVHEAARIGALAVGGEILASTRTIGPLDRLRVSEPRMVTLKGFSEPCEVVAVSWE